MGKTHFVDRHQCDFSLRYSNRWTPEAVNFFYSSGFCLSQFRVQLLDYFKYNDIFGSNLTWNLTLSTRPCLFHDSIKNYELLFEQNVDDKVRYLIHKCLTRLTSANLEKVIVNTSNDWIVCCFIFREIVQFPSIPDLHHNITIIVTGALFSIQKMVQCNRSPLKFKQCIDIELYSRCKQD